MALEEALARDYPDALVRLATCYSRGTADVQPRASLILAYAELRASGEAPARTVPLERLDVRDRRGTSVFWREVALDASAALAWYRSPPSGVTTPVPRDVDAARGDGSPIEVGDLLDEPSWPNLVVPFQSNLEALADCEYGLPFLERGREAVRFHRRMAAPGSELAELVACTDVREWLDDRLRVDLVEYPEFLGGMVLLAPDPVLRRVACSIVPDADDPTPERLVVRLESRPGRDASELRVTASTARQGALVTREDGIVGSQRHLIFHSPVDIRQSGVTVTCPSRGVLRHEPVTPIIRSASGTLGVASRHVSITAPDRRGSRGEEQTRQVTHYDRSESIGIPDRVERDDRLFLLAKAADDRARHRLARRLDQQWLRDREQSREFVRERIASASERVWLCDPYIADLELLWFAHDAQPDVPLTILTSRAAEFDRDLSALAAMVHQVRELSRLRPDGTVRVRVLSGDPPPLHDRFLVCDDSVWLCGNSFGTAGERAGVMIRLPDHEEPIRELGHLIDHPSRTRGLATYAVDRVRALRKSRVRRDTSKFPTLPPPRRGPYRR